MRRTPSEAPSASLLAAHSLDRETEATPSQTASLALRTHHTEQIPSIVSID